MGDVPEIPQQIIESRKKGKNMSDLDLIMADVERAERTGTPIYDGTARTIAASWHSSQNIGFLRLSSSGAITDELDLEIQYEKSYVQRHPENFDMDESVKDLGTAAQNVRMLDELLTSVRKHGNRGEQAGWDRVWADKLTEDMEYNTDEE